MNIMGITEKNKIKRNKIKPRKNSPFGYPPILLLYQAYVCKERTKHRFANQTRKQVKNLAIILTNKKQKVQTIF